MKKQVSQEPVKELVAQSADENDIAFPEEELNIPNALIIEETTTENGTTTSTRSKIVVKDVPAPGSTAHSWITPADKRKSFTAKSGETPVESGNEQTKSITSGASTTSSTSAGNPDENKQGRIEKSNVPKKLPLALISANVSGGPAPLYVEFKSTNSAQHIEWNFGDGRTSKEIAPVHKFDEPGTYVVTLTLRDTEGNVSTDQVNIQVREGSVIELPNVFSPNGDGINDVFVCKECRNLERIQISVIDLSGKTVFYSEQIEFEWDGRDQSGIPCRRELIWSIIWLMIFTERNTEKQLD
jgi:gliding motility-associated-like protein